MDYVPQPNYAVPSIGGPVRRAGPELHGLWFAALLAAAVISGGLQALTIALFGTIDDLGLRRHMLMQSGFGGLLAGTAQWLVLRRYAPVSWAWIPVAALASMAASVTLETPLSWVLALLPVGGGQALVLARRLRGAGWWAAAVAVSTLLSILLAILLYSGFSGQLSADQYWMLWIANSLAVTILRAAIEGGALRWILRRNSGQAAPYPGYR